jgi:hypothetical protein
MGGGREREREEKAWKMTYFKKHRGSMINRGKVDAHAMLSVLHGKMSSPYTALT